MKDNEPARTRTSDARSLLEVEAPCGVHKRCIATSCALQIHFCVTGCKPHAHAQGCIDRVEKRNNVFFTKNLFKITRVARRKIRKFSEANFSEIFRKFRVTPFENRNIGNRASNPPKQLW